jgi:phosphoribosyl-ATP pyrophosphohydrolase
LKEYPPITGELRAAMTTALDGATDEELVYCRTARFNDLCDRIDAVHSCLERMAVLDKTDDSMQTLTVRPFVHGSDKDVAHKVVEEAAEAFSAWEDIGTFGMPSYYLADEIADTITACVNLAHRHNIDLQAALVRVEERNRERGRYDG